MARSSTAEEGAVDEATWAEHLEWLLCLAKKYRATEVTGGLRFDQYQLINLSRILVTTL